MHKDIIGKAIQDYHQGHYTEDIIVQSPDFDDDSIPIPYLFRGFDEMPVIEQKALELCRGRVLDVGCGAGSHSLYLQKHTGCQVTAIDISPGAINICKQRGITNAEVKNIFELEEGDFDTLLLLMNGSGIIGRLDQIDHFFIHLKKLLAPGGQMLLDSSDLSYLFMEDDGGMWIDAAAGYYGEMQYKMLYKEESTDWFDWLYIDYNTLQNAANYHGFICDLVYEGEHYDYLARLILNNS